MTSSHSTADISSLDQLTGGAFSATHSGDRSTLLRDWLATQPSLAQLQEVHREMSARDKGAAKVLKERMDELKRVQEQDSLLAQWADKAEQLLAGARLNIADALAWQRDAAKAGAPLSREPLASLKNRMAEVVRRVEDLQHQVMVQREAAVLLAQRIEVLSTKALQEAHASREALQADVLAWVGQADALTTDSSWASVDLKFAPQLEASRSQLQAVWTGFDAALQQAAVATAQNANAAMVTTAELADAARVYAREWCQDLEIRVPGSGISVRTIVPSDPGQQVSVAPAPSHLPIRARGADATLHGHGYEGLTGRGLCALLEAVPASSSISVSNSLHISPAVRRRLGALAAERGIRIEVNLPAVPQ